jgi:hypothetical protein
VGADYIKASRLIRCESILDRIQVLRQTLERRFRPDAVVEAALDNVQVEVELLAHDIKEKD